MNSFIMVWDPTGEVPEGEIVLPQLASALTAKGAVLLPTDTSVHKDQALGAFVKRSWGNGFPAGDLPGLRYFAPLALYGEPQHTKFAWAVRLRQVTQNDVTGVPIAMNGQCAVHPMGGQRGAGNLAYAPNDMPIPLVTLGPADMHGGWTLKGTGNVNIGSPGYYAFALAGAVMGVRVMWVAATFSKE